MQIEPWRGKQRVRLGRSWSSGRLTSQHPRVTGAPGSQVSPLRMCGPFQGRPLINASGRGGPGIMRTLHHSGGPRASLRGPERQPRSCSYAKETRYPGADETFRAGGEGEEPSNALALLSRVLTVAGSREPGAHCSPCDVKLRTTEQLNSIITATSARSVAETRV